MDKPTVTHHWVREKNFWLVAMRVEDGNSVWWRVPGSTSYHEGNFDEIGEQVFRPATKPSEPKGAELNPGVGCDVSTFFQSPRIMLKARWGETTVTVPLHPNRARGLSHEFAELVREAEAFADHARNIPFEIDDT